MSERRPADPAADPSIARVLTFMTACGRHYAERIDNLRQDFEAIQFSSGPEAHLCPTTQKLLDDIDQAIWDIAQDAVDRYDDWASDPLP